VIIPGLESGPLCSLAEGRLLDKEDDEGYCEFLALPGPSQSCARELSALLAAPEPPRARGLMIYDGILPRFKWSLEPSATRSNGLRLMLSSFRVLVSFKKVLKLSILLEEKSIYKVVCDSSTYSGVTPSFRES
jgi:hypothetical protein